MLECPDLKVASHPPLPSFLELLPHPLVLMLLILYDNSLFSPLLFFSFFFPKSSPRPFPPSPFSSASPHCLVSSFSSGSRK